MKRKKIVLSIVLLCMGSSVLYAEESLQKDKEFILKAIDINPDILKEKLQTK